MGNNKLLDLPSALKEHSAYLLEKETASFKVSHNFCPDTGVLHFLMLINSSCLLRKCQFQKACSMWCAISWGNNVFASRKISTLGDKWIQYLYTIYNRYYNICSIYICAVCVHRYNKMHKWTITDSFNKATCFTICILLSYWKQSLALAGSYLKAVILHILKTGYVVH